MDRPVLAPVVGFLHQVLLGGVRFVHRSYEPGSLVQCRVVAGVGRRFALTALALAAASTNVPAWARWPLLAVGLGGLYRCVSHLRSISATRRYCRPYHPGDVLVFDLVKDPAGPRGSAAQLITAVAGREGNRRVLAFVNPSNLAATHFWLETMGASAVPGNHRALPGRMLVEYTRS